MNTAYLLTGGNLGDRARNLKQAHDMINTACGSIELCSALYETAPWGNTDQSMFLNQALKLRTRLPPEELLERLMDIEHLMGRIREERYGPRLIDLDILLYDQAVLRKPDLSIPHPELANRRFALIPLAEIAGPFKHPVSGKTIIQLLEECPDKLPVHRYKGNGIK